MNLGLQRPLAALSLHWPRVGAWTMPPRSFLLGSSWEQQGGVHTPSGQTPLLPVTGIQLYGTRVKCGGWGG